MEVDLSVLPSLFVDSLAYWWIIIPATVLGIVVGAIPGFSAANTIIILLPLTLAMTAEAGMIFMVCIYTASRLGAGIPAIPHQGPSQKQFLSLHPFHPFFPARPWCE